MWAASRTASALLPASRMPASRSRVFLALQILRIGGRAADEAERPGGVRPRRRPAPIAVSIDRGDDACRIGVGAVAEHDVEQDHGGLRILRFGGKRSLRKR